MEEIENVKWCVFKVLQYSISSVLVKCTKTEYFSHWGSNFASDFHVKMMLNHVFEKQIYIFLRITQVLGFFLLKISVLLETTPREMFYFIG